MSVQLLQPYNGFPKGDIVNIDNATEAALVGQGIGRYVSNPGESFQPLTASEQQSIRDSISGTGPLVTTTPITVTAAQPAPLKSPSAATAYDLIATSVRDAYAQLPVASFGDSIALVSAGVPGFDIRQASGGGTYSLSDARMGLTLTALSGGAIRLVANCGISGENTTQMLARDLAGASSTRKALADAVATGARIAVFSAGINDGQAVAPGASNAVIAAAVAASVANMKKLCWRAMSLGIIPIVPALLGYTYTPGSGLGTANPTLVPTVQEFVRQWNAAMKAAFAAAGTAMGYWEDSFISSIVDASGNWLPGMDQGDGLHPSINGCNLIYAPIVSRILWLEGCSGASPLCYPAGLANLVANADYAASSSGLATGVTAAEIGTVTRTNSLVEIDGVLWQSVLCTPTALNGSGNCGVQIDTTFANATVVSGDVLGAEMSFRVDDGTGGPPTNVFGHALRLLMAASYTDSPSFNPTISPKIGLRAPLNRRYHTFPLIAPSSAPSASIISLIILANSLTPFRVLLRQPRVVKLPTTY